MSFNGKVTYEEMPNAKEKVMYEVKPTLCEFVDVEAHLESIDCVVLRLLDKSLKD